MYGLVGAGIAVYSYEGFSNPDNLYMYGINNRGIRPNFQFTPCGLQFGGRLSGLIELGIGYKGLLNTGICYRVGKERVLQKTAYQLKKEPQF